MPLAQPSNPEKVQAAHSLPSHLPELLSRPVSPPCATAAPVVDGTAASQSSPSTIKPYPKLRLRLCSAFIAYFLCGWGDGVTGTIMPYLKIEYDLSFTVLSLLFVASTVGFGLGTVFVEPGISMFSRTRASTTRPFFFPALPNCFKRNLTHHNRIISSPSQARWLTLIYAVLLHALHFVLMGIRKGFPPMFIAYVLAAIARGFMTAVLNMYVSETPGKRLGVLLGCWSFGSLVAPLVCQSIIAAGVYWPQFYYGSLVVSAVTLILVTIAFYPTKEEFAIDLQPTVASTTDTPSDEKALADLYKDVQIEHTEAASQYVLARALKNHYLLAFCLFITLYYGTETVAQGYAASFLLQARNANPNVAGYVTSGFWGGITVARVAWGYVEPSLSFSKRKHIMHVGIGLCVILYVLIWTIPNQMLGYPCFSLMGLVLGIMYPATLALSNLCLPHEFHMVAMAMISFMGSFGSALFPFVAGIIINTFGAKTLVYMGTAQSSALFILWAFFPSKRPTVITNIA